MARQWSAQKAWFVPLESGPPGRRVRCRRHRGHSLRRTPPFERDDQRLVYDIVTELSTTKTLGRKASYDGLVASFGLQRTIEFMTATSFYTMVAMMLNAFDAPVPGNARPLP